jgi:Kef-type K+ transport system membrane component KefB
MPKLSQPELLYFLIQLILLLVFARFFGELAKRLRQPAIVGEIIGGIVLGPSVFKQVLPAFFNTLYLAHPNSSIAMDGVFQVSVIMMLFISGMEIDLPMLIRNRRTAFSISAIGMIIPLLLGTVCGWTFYRFFSQGAEESRFVFALFFGTALSITALPVIAKILMDINLLNTEIGSLIITSAMLDDFVGWILFAIILNLMPQVVESEKMPVAYTAVLTITFAILTLTVVRYLVNILFNFLNKRVSGPGGPLSIAMAMCFAGAVFTEYIGIHAVFGAFFMGIAFGNAKHFSKKSKDIIHQFVSNIFAPLFFTSIGLRVNFIASFDLQIVLIILVIAYATKLTGGFIGGKIGGLSNYKSLSVGFGINARGAMEIILALIALSYKLIDERIFVALTIMALITSLTSGYFIKYFLAKDKVTTAEHSP